METPRHLFVCAGLTCRQAGAEETLQQIHTQLGSRQAQSRVRITLCHCLGQCGHGPNMVVYADDARPDGVWYAHVGEKEAREIVDRHLLGGRPVARLVHDPID